MVSVMVCKILELAATIVHPVEPARAPEHHSHPSLTTPTTQAPTTSHPAPCHNPP
jgi:hypothetical protein